MRSSGNGRDSKQGEKRRKRRLTRIEKEHGKVKQMVKSLQSLISTGDVGNLSLLERRELLGTLVSLKKHLARHFKFEEEGGFLSDVLQAVPRHSRRVARLRQEHDQIIDELASAIRAAQSCHKILEAIRRGATKEPIIAARKVVKILACHEANEIGLIQDAYLNDIGVGD